MAKQTINLGTAPSGQDGDDARTAFQKANANFDELYSGTVSQPTNAKLSAISASVWAANQLMYSTGANTMAMTPLTAAGRALLDDADAAAQRTTLGLGGTILQALQALAMTANGVPYMTSTAAMAVSASTAFGRGLWNLADAAAARAAFGALGVGDYGFGGAAPAVSPTLGGLAATQFFVSGANTTDVPVGAGTGTGQGYGIHIQHSNPQYAEQEWTQLSTKRKFFRVKAANVWLPWTEIYHAENIVGTVSQSGGTPTGAIFEQGSNANGHYIKYACGAMICWGEATYTSGITTAIVTSVFVSAAGYTITWPVAFASSAPVELSGGVTGGSYRVICVPYRANTANGTMTFQLYISSTADVTFSWKALGRWF